VNDEYVRIEKSDEIFKTRGTDFSNIPRLITIFSLGSNPFVIYLSRENGKGTCFN